MPYQNTKRGAIPDAGKSTPLHLIPTASLWDRRHKEISVARAVVVLSFTGAVLWYLLWKLAVHVWGWR